MVIFSYVQITYGDTFATSGKLVIQLNRIDARLLASLFEFSFEVYVKKNPLVLGWLSGDALTPEKLLPRPMVWNGICQKTGNPITLRFRFDSEYQCFLRHIRQCLRLNVQYAKMQNMPEDRFTLEHVVQEAISDYRAELLNTDVTYMKPNPKDGVELIGFSMPTLSKIANVAHYVGKYNLMNPSYTQILRIESVPENEHSEYGYLKVVGRDLYSSIFNHPMESDSEEVVMYALLAPPFLAGFDLSDSLRLVKLTSPAIYIDVGNALETYRFAIAPNTILKRITTIASLI